MHIFMELFEGAAHVAQVLSLLQLAFTVWMLVDAYQRGAETFWYFVIFFLQPIGTWVYFFAVKFRTLRTSRWRPTLSGERKRSLDELRYSVERSPTVANRFALAERLMETGVHREAIGLLEMVLATEPDYCAVLHALAGCRLATNDPEQAVAPLEKLIHRDPCWSNYRAWRTLVDVHVARGQSADALAACRELARRQPTLENKCLLAEHLLDNGGPSEAAHLLDEALRDYHYAPWSVRWHNRHWAREARRLLAEAEQGQTRKEV